MAKQEHDILHNIQVASPCKANWSEMSGDDRTRLCHACKTTVHNIAELTPAEVEHLVTAAQTEKICIRLYRRSDGTVITRDCPVGLAAVRRKLIGLYSTLAAIAVSIFFLMKPSSTVRYESRKTPLLPGSAEQSMPTYGLLNVKGHSGAHVTDTHAARGTTTDIEFIENPNTHADTTHAKQR